MVLPEHAHAVAIASEALDPGSMERFGFSLAVTTRMYARVVVEAIDEEHAVQLLRQLNLEYVGTADFTGGDWHLDHEDIDIMGDEIAYNDDSGAEISLRHPGEPYSWDAIAIVKRLAQVETLTSSEFSRFCEEARNACGLNLVQQKEETT